MNSTSNFYEMMLVPLQKFLYTFVVMEVTFFTFTAQDAVKHAGAACAIILAFLLRIAMEWGKNTLNGKNAVIQAISTVSLCFVSIYIWHDFLKWNKGFEIYVFFASLFSVFIVGEIEVVFKIGFRRWLKGALVKLMATDDKEDKKDV